MECLVCDVCKIEITVCLILSITGSNTSVNTKPDQQLEKPRREIPGPSSAAFVFQYIFRKFVPNNRDIIAELYDQYGPIIKIKGLFGSPTLILLFDAEAASHILRSENQMPIRVGFQSLDYFRKEHKKTIDNVNKLSGLLTDHGEPWKKFRSTVNPIMLQPKIIKQYKSSLSEVAEDMIKRMRLIRNTEDKLERNFSNEMNLWALESIGVVALGGRLNALDLHLPDNSPAKRLIKTIHDIFEISEDIDFNPSMWRYVSTPQFRKAMNLYENQLQLSKFYIEKAKEEFKNKDNSLGEEKGILEKLLEIDENIAVTMVTDMLFGGIDTAANSVLTTLYLLAKNPEKQNKLRQELLSQTEKRPYLKACVKEAIRMMPVVSGNMRKITKDYDVLGYRLPKDTYVNFGHQLLSSMEQHFPRSKEYIPERWITEKTDPLHHSNAHPFAYNPFGFGVRSCIGRRIAELEMETFVGKVVENFHIEWFGAPLKIKSVTINYAMPPYNFIFKDVK